MEPLLFKAGENVEAVRKITQETPRLYLSTLTEISSPLQEGADTFTLWIGRVELAKWLEA
jgi:hypothetical protein